jgi:hypothetical protein
MEEKTMKFEMLVIPNIWSATDGEKGETTVIVGAETFDEAIKIMKEDIEDVKDSPIANAYHYDIWEYDDEDNIINCWVFDWKGKEIENFEEWLKTLSEEELRDV